MNVRFLSIMAAGLCAAVLAGPLANTQAAESDRDKAGPEPVLNPARLMEHVLSPAAFTVWDSVGYVVDKSGTHMNAPETAEEWKEVADGAAIVAESRNLLLVPGRALDETWIKYSVALSEAGLAAFKAAEARDPEAVFKAGSRMTEACQGCHEKYGVQRLE